MLAWPGYAENGSTDPTMDWVGPFEQQTGCKVAVKTFATSAEAVQLFATGEYDVISASGDASLGWSTATACSRSTPRSSPTTPTSSPT